ncbi:MAG: PUR family DNA/RNA-binding protein [Saprospiraceae bacterium]|nr:PUR family DNA/RNA-binding protein [Saprospiraceae bacterium]
MDNERNQRRFESVYSRKVRAGKRRTYFFDVRKTKGDDYYLTLTESTRKFNGEGYERHKIFLYKEDFNRFVASLEEVVDYVKTELMPDYDYDEYTRRHEEFERQKALEESGGGGGTQEEEDSTTATDNGEVESEDDMSW